MKISTILLLNRFEYDTTSALREKIKTFLSIDTGKIARGKIFSLETNISEAKLYNFATSCLKDPLIHLLFINTLPEISGFNSFLCISKKPGLSDDEGKSVETVFYDFFGHALNDNSLEKSILKKQGIFSHEIFYFESFLSDEEVLKIGSDFLGNPAIHDFFGGSIKKISKVTEFIKRVHFENFDFLTDDLYEVINLEVGDKELIEISKKRLLSLNLEEMKTIKEYFSKASVQKERTLKELSPDGPTDCEIEIIAQTWSEHCKHKIFNSEIEFETGEKTERINSLFNTYIKKATSIVEKRLEKWGRNRLLSVFKDNAGVVKVNDNTAFCFKVETHNSPSAIEPYNGALTGIVGVNRDPLGTGVGGGKLIFNTDVLCFSPGEFDETKAKLHPRRVIEGVVRGISDGGNKSGIPTINGAIVFDDRYSAKPLVFCGTGAIMPLYSKDGNPSWEKVILPGDRIVMVGGAVGRDGIHGATFSSDGLKEDSSIGAVQIGSPYTQKKLREFMEEAFKRGLFRTSTDNGAGGLSSSVGELALLCGGAILELDRVPLKTKGLKPWEIVVSESQERMTLAVAPEHFAELEELARVYEVGIADIGVFTATGFFEIKYFGKTVGLLELEFLHNGVPQKKLKAEWKAPKPVIHESVEEKKDYGAILKKLLKAPNITSKEDVIRRYDHEVLGNTVLKPLMGNFLIDRYSPQDAGIVRIDYESYQGIMVANGILPRYVDLDPYNSSAGAFDEALRQIVSAGGIYKENREGSFFFATDNFCMPDPEYDEFKNPSGKVKLGKLVLMAKALFDVSTFFNIPLISGKDSMKNDFVDSSGKIVASIPETVMFSVLAIIDDVRKVVTAEFKNPGDLIYLVGNTYDELGGSEFLALFKKRNSKIPPKLRMDEAKRVYTKIGEANRKGLIKSCHDISDGGLLVCISESLFAGNVGAEINIKEVFLPAESFLFSESFSRFVVTVAPENKSLFEAIFGNDAMFLGEVTKKPELVLHFNGKKLLCEKTDELYNAWTSGFKAG